MLRVVVVRAGKKEAVAIEDVLVFQHVGLGLAGYLRHSVAVT
jgi:hypothetical protein